MNEVRPALLASVMLTLATLIPAIAQSQIGLLGQREENFVTWAEGTVRDERGQPIAGAKVFARGHFHGGIRFYELVRATTSAADGNYRITGPDKLASFSAALVASVPGHPPALSWIDAPESHSGDPLFGDPIPKLPGSRVDLVVPDRGGVLDVLVVKNGKPLAGSRVAVRLEGADPFDLWGMGGQSEASDSLYRVCRPTARTGPDGIAHFDAPEFKNWRTIDQRRPYGKSSRITVRSDERASHQLSVGSHASEQTFEVLRDGAPWKDREPVGTAGELPSGERAGHGHLIAGDQSGKVRFEQSGLGAISLIRASNTSRSPRTFPFYSADAFVAASLRLPGSSPISLTAAENRGGIIRVRIEDELGRPVAGTAQFKGVRRGGLSCNSARQEIPAGGAFIEGFEPTAGWVHGTISGQSRFEFTENYGRIPLPGELAGRSEVLPHPVTAENNREREITLRPQKVGYVYGRLIVPAGRDVSDYRVLLGRADSENGAGVYTEPWSGKFVAGPFRDGPALLVVFRTRGSGPLLFKPIDIHAGEAVELDISIPKNVEALSPGRRSLDAQVVLSDGKTPASLAVVAWYSPRDTQVWQVGLTDTSGRLRPRGMFSIDETDFSVPPGTPQHPVAIAWAPGRCGAAVANFPEHLDQPLVITLPPPKSLRGKIVVEDDEPTLTNGAFTVRAQYQGRGKLNDVLSVETTASANGEFELAGLTPGQYVVQGALDGIWLSSSATITVGDAPIASMTLTIAPPGGPVLVRMVGERDRNLEELIVDHPEGPLADRLWPKSLSPDGAGVIRIPALESGRHRLRIGSQQILVDVPCLAESKGHALEVDFPVH